MISTSLIKPTHPAFRTRAMLIPAASPESVESKVEEKDGYWVLKDKFRDGINPQEKVKLAKEPMSLLFDAGIQELAGMTIDEVDASKLSKDDVDVRLKWLGFFHRRKHQYRPSRGKEKLQ